MPVYGIPSLKPADDLDTRREVLYLFSRMTRQRRLAFLNGLIRKHELRIHAYSEVDSPSEQYFDFWLLAVQYHIPLQLALTDLEAFSK